MQFESIAIIVIALAILVFLYARRHVITDLKAANEELRTQLARLRDVAQRQRQEIDRLIDTAEEERRARQLATLALAGGQKPTQRPPITPRREWKDPDLARDPFKSSVNRQAAATRAPARQQDAPANTWETPGMPYTPAIAPSPAPAQAAAYHGGGGSFDGGGASGDYGRSDSSACTSSSSSSSDSGSSSSSDSGSSCSSSD